MWKALKGALGRVLLAIGMASFITAAFSLTVPPTFAPRYFPWQVVHYERHIVNLASTGMTADNLFVCTYTTFSCSVKVGALPYNAFILRAYMQVTIACTGATACGLGMGTGNAPATTGVNIAANTSILATGLAASMTLANAGLGTVASPVTGNGAAQTGTDGGFDLYITVTGTVANPTAGQAVLVLEYLAPNDGACTPAVPMGATAGAC